MLGGAPAQLRRLAERPHGQRLPANRGLAPHAEAVRLKLLGHFPQTKADMVKAGGFSGGGGISP